MITTVHSHYHQTHHIHPLGDLTQSQLSLHRRTSQTSCSASVTFASGTHDKVYHCSPTALALGSLAIVKVSGRTLPLAFLGANSFGLGKGSVEGSPNICLPVLSVLLGPWGTFRWPRKRFSGFCGRFPRLFFKFVSQSSLQTPVFSGYVEVSPNPSVNLSPNFLFEKGSVEGYPNFFPNSLSFGVGSHSQGVLCSKFLSAPKTFFGVFPKQFFTFLSQCPAVFWANGCCFRKGSVEGFANYSLHLSPKLIYKSSFEGSANCPLHLSPSVLLGSKLRELFTRLTHTNPVRRKQHIMSLLLGYSLGFFHEKSTLAFFFSQTVTA